MVTINDQPLIAPRCDCAAAPVEDRQGWSKAPAVGDDYDRHPGEGQCTVRIAVHSRKLDGRFIKEAPEAVRFPEFPGARIGGIDGKLRRHQHRIYSGGRDLRRHLLAVVHVLSEIGVAAEIDVAPMAVNPRIQKRLPRSGTAPWP